MADETFDITSWTIQNISCWNQDLHGKYIESSKLTFTERVFKIQLYPRGTSGKDDRMVVYLLFNRQDEFSCDLSFIGGDGSTLYTQRMVSQDECNVKLPPGPKFEEVIDKRSDRKDKLTLRFQIKSYIQDEINVCTIIRVFDVTLEVDPSERDPKMISFFRYKHDDYDTGIYLEWGDRRRDERIKICMDKLVVDPDPEDVILVKTHLRFVSSDGSILRCENNENVFDGENLWTFSESLTEEEVSEKVRSVILHLKVISGTVSHSVRHFYLENAKIISNRYVSACMEKSPTETDINAAITHNDRENCSVYVLSKELKDLYQDEGFSDLQLQCKEVSFPVHRNILSARSTFFKTMLSNDRTQLESDCLDIEDLDPSTLSLFLAFLYTGSVEDLQWESAFKLYNAAHKYQVPSLKTECVGFLSANVSVSNICDVLSLGDKHQDEKLTAAAQDFILRNYNEVLKSEEWNSFKVSEPILAVNTLTHFATKGFVTGNLNAF